MSLVRRLRRSRTFSDSRRVFWYLFWPCSFFIIAYIFVFRQIRARATSGRSALIDSFPSQLPEYTITSAAYELQHSRIIHPRSLTVVLPVTCDSLTALQNILLPFLGFSSQIHQVLVVCPESLFSQTRRAIHRIVSEADEMNVPEFSIRPWFVEATNLVTVAPQVSTEWVLFLDEMGLQQLSDGTREMLLRPPAVSLPVGPRGFSGSPQNVYCIFPSQTPQPASYLVPPFVMSTSLAIEFAEISDFSDWASLGEHVSRSRSDDLGGIVLGFQQSSREWCKEFRPLDNGNILEDINSFDFASDSLLLNDSAEHVTWRFPETSGTSGVFAILLPTLQDLRLFASVACRLQDSGYVIQALLYYELAAGSNGFDDQTVKPFRCRLTYDVLSEDAMLPVRQHGYPFLSEWLDTFDIQPDVVLALLEDGAFPAVGSTSTLVRIPREDLPYSSWMGSLSLAEWQNWNIPRIDVCIITKDRPYSLARLLASLSRGKFFGDSLDLRLHLEQSVDVTTMQMVDHFEWEHGSVFAHHRVIHGGLLPAVVESWYPHSNHSYGLLLEDDVELSPLFYAWIKMSVLRYRYGQQGNKSPQLFGVSLYQQKNIELPLEGRKPFNARASFQSSGIFDASTPYLSQIPCSWGAVYFPEHWREFHDYLSVRFSEGSLPIEQNVVPDVRSNKWTKSWKKFFIELAYLRGYVMLYPNYRDFMSLSTNHLEVGSHVKDRSKEKQELFFLPLMKSSQSQELLDLPGRTLPVWDALPVLNLTGSLTSLDALASVGNDRRLRLIGCKGFPAPYDAQELMCTDSNVPT